MYDIMQEFGVTEVRDLIPDGRNVLVTDVNKADYIRLVCQEKMTGAIRKQLAAFLEGFYDIIPRRCACALHIVQPDLYISQIFTTSSFSQVDCDLQRAGA